MTTAVAVNPLTDSAARLEDLLPRGLREQRRFIVFEVVQDPETGKFGKLGKIAGTDTNARSNTPADWVTFEEAARDGRALGIAMGDELAGVDLDDCFSDDDELSPWARTIIEAINSYTERSVSGHGLHVLCRIEDVPAELLNDEGRPTFRIFPSSLLQPGTTGQVEVYAGSHFMTLTGDVKSRPTIERRDAEFAALAVDLTARRRKEQEARWKAAAATWASTDHEFAACQLSDEEVKAKLLADSSGSRHWNIDGGSEGDFGLLSKLAFYCGGNENQMERLLCASPRGGRIRHEREMRDDLQYVRSSIVKVMAAWSGGFYNPQAYAAARREEERAGHCKQTERAVGGWGLSRTQDVAVERPDEPLRELRERHQEVLTADDMTDLGYADRMMAVYGEDILWCEALKTWLSWDGRRWEMEVSLRVNRLAESVHRMTVDAFYALPEGAQRTKGVNTALTRQGITHIDHTIKAVRTQAEARPEGFDRHPMLLNVANGTIDLRTGELLPHDRRHRITKVAGVSHDPTAECPQWLAFLDRILGGDADLIEYLQRLFGAALAGEQRDRVFPMFWGPGGNGKTQLVAVIEGVLGEYAGKVRPEILATKVADGESHSEGIANLRGLRFVSCDETADGDRLNESLIKRLTGGDTVKARKCYGHEFEYRPQLTLVLDTNHKPTITGGGRAIWDRIRVIPFDAIITPEERIPNYGEKLVAEEGAGILRWALEGCLRWQRESLDREPKIVSEATVEYRRDEDKVGRFLAECCLLDPTASTQASTLYDAYKAWTLDQGLHPEGMPKFKKKLEEDHGIRPIKGRKHNAFTGVALDTGGWK